MLGYLLSIDHSIHDTATITMSQDLTEGDDEDEKISLLAVASYLYLLLGEGK